MTNIGIIMIAVALSPLAVIVFYIIRLILAMFIIINTISSNSNQIPLHNYFPHNDRSSIKRHAM